MGLNDLIEQIYDAFCREKDGAKVILLHPESRYRSVLVARLLNETGIPSFYYAFGPDDTSLQALMNSMAHDLSAQVPAFGRHLHMLPPRVYTDFNTYCDLILETFVLELRELSSEPFLFILDEYDRSDSSDEIQHFFEKLFDHLPEHCQLVLNSRILPRLPWVSLIAQKQALILHDDRPVQQGFYGPAPCDDCRLEIFGLGPGYVLLDGRPIDIWEGHLPRLLLFFALDRPVVTRSEICQSFWPELDTDQAVNVFHVTKRRLHKALEMDVLVHEDAYYRINPELTIYYDVIEFVEVLLRARRTQSLPLWEQVARIYRGPFLQGQPDGWIVRRRQAFCAGYVEAMHHIAVDWLQKGQQELALRTYLTALEADGENEQLHRSVLRLYTDLGRRSEAVAHYQMFTAQLKNRDAEPEPITQSLYDEINIS